MSLGSACSSGWPACSTAIVNDAIDYAAAADVVIVISAGNNSRTSVGQPGNHPEAIAVSALGYNQAPAYYSNRGSALSLAGPGGDTRVDLNDDGFPDIGAAPNDLNDRPVTGTFDPEGAAVLSAFNGEDASGEWRLTIDDTVGGDSGTLLNYELRFTYPL